MKLYIILYIFILIVFIPIIYASEWVMKPLILNSTVNYNTYNTYIYNESNIWNRTGTTVSFINSGDTLDLGGSTLTNVGELIVTTITLKGNLTPDTTELYNIGSSSNWINNLWVKNIFAKEINSTNINTKNISAEEGDVDNMTTAQTNYGNFVIMNDSQDLRVILG